MRNASVILRFFHRPATIDDVQELTGGAAVRAAAGEHPYARFATSVAADVHGLADGMAVIWVGHTHNGLLGHALGPVDDLTPVARGLLDGVRWINLTRRTRFPAGYIHNEDWDLRWSTTAPAPQPGEGDVVEITDDDAVNELLDVAMPETTVRAGQATVRQWYGIWSGGQLVACAADRSGRSDAPVGAIAAVAVHPDHRRHGLGAAISAALTNRLRERYDLVTLGVYAGNERASRLYARLGYTGLMEITSVRRPT